MKIHYKYFQGYSPKDTKRNYLCFTLITPTGSKNILAIDEDELTRAIEYFNGDDQQAAAAETIRDKIWASVNNGKTRGFVDFNVNNKAV